MFNKTFGCCRKVYNLMLQDRIDSYKTTGVMEKPTPAQYKKQFPFLKEVDSFALCNEQLHLQNAYKNFFAHKARFPKFKSSKHSRKSYTTNNQKGTIAIIGNGIKLPKIGIVKTKIHRLPEENWELKSATISQDPDGKFYASLLFKFKPEIALTKNFDNAIGLDYKSNGLYIDSNGNKPKGNHKYFRKSQKKLARAQRKQKNKVKGSNNYKKQKQRIAKIYKKAANQRKDFLHKTSTEIANQYDVVCVETLNMKAIGNKKFHNGKATFDNGYGMFLNMLEYKLANRGKHFVKIDKWYPSSQICSCCGNKQKLSLSQRAYECACGLVIDRDLNAAINIKNEGLRILKAA